MILGWIIVFMIASFIACAIVLTVGGAMYAAIRAAWRWLMTGSR